MYVLKEWNVVPLYRCHVDRISRQKGLLFSSSSSIELRDRFTGESVLFDDKIDSKSLEYDILRGLLSIEIFSDRKNPIKFSRFKVSLTRGSFNQSNDRPKETDGFAKTNGC